jgi:hypothetical protein
MSTQIAACVFIALSALNICLGVMKDDPLPVAPYEQTEGAR